MAITGCVLAENGYGGSTSEPVNEPIEENLDNRYGSSDEKETEQRFTGVEGNYETEEEPLQNGNGTLSENGNGNNGGNGSN